MLLAQDYYARQAAVSMRASVVVPHLLLLLAASNNTPVGCIQGTGISDRGFLRVQAVHDRMRHRAQG